MRLIDADAFKAFWNKEYRMLYPNDKYLVALSNFPTIDPESLRPKGEWVHNEYYVEWAERYVCSVCNRNAPSDGDCREMLYNFCPNCGADMRKEG